MDLTLREAADLLRVNPRTLRGWLGRKKIVGHKQANGQWLIPRRDLPLTDAQREVIQDRAQQIRAVVEEALPSRTARHAAERRRSFVDLEIYRAAHALLLEVRASVNDPTGEQQRALELGIEELCVGTCAFDLDTKLPALRAARALFARFLARVLLTSAATPAQPQIGWVQRLEHEILPTLGGMLRWAEKLEAKR